MPINGQNRRLDLAPGVTLPDELRDYAGLIGTKCDCAASATGRKIVTIEGLFSGQGLQPIQRACAAALLGQDPSPTAAGIRGGIQGHIFRRGAYPRIGDAVRAAASKRKESGRG